MKPFIRTTVKILSSLSFPRCSIEGWTSHTSDIHPISWHVHGTCPKLCKKIGNRKARLLKSVRESSDSITVTRRIKKCPSGGHFESQPVPSSNSIGKFVGWGRHVLGFRSWINVFKSITYSQEKAVYKSFWILSFDTLVCWAYFLNFKSIECRSIALSRKTFYDRATAILNLTPAIFKHFVKQC